MSKTVVIHQPDFLPYLGFFHRLLKCDFFVILDHVQFNKRGWHHRDKIKGPQGETWVSIPIKNINKKQKINEAAIDYSTDWRKKHLNKLRSYYGKAKYFDELFFELEEIYKVEYKLMADFNIELLKFLMRAFDVKINFSLSSVLNIETMKDYMNIDIVKKVGGTRYLSGIGAKAYTDPDLFRKEGIELVWQDFKHPVYPQLHNDFIPYLSSIDLLFNCGVSKSREILRSC
jgi:hypothetical protein